jgi:hypothetical protein
MMQPVDTVNTLVRTHAEMDSVLREDMETPAALVLQPTRIILIFSVTVFSFTLHPKKKR